LRSPRASPPGTLTPAILCCAANMAAAQRARPGERGSRALGAEAGAPATELLIGGQRRGASV
jgi:hypothetical protein